MLLCDEKMVGTQSFFEGVEMVKSLALQIRIGINIV